MALIRGKSELDESAVEGDGRASSCKSGWDPETVGGGGGGCGVRGRRMAADADGVTRPEVGARMRGIDDGTGPRNAGRAEGIDTDEAVPAGTRDDEEDDMSGSGVLCKLLLPEAESAANENGVAPPTRRIVLAPLSSPRTSWTGAASGELLNEVDSGRTPWPPVRCCSRWRARSLVDDMGTKPPALARRGVEGVCGREDESDDDA